MKKILFTSLMLIAVISFGFTGAGKRGTAGKTFIKVKIGNSKTTDVYAMVGYVGEAPGGGQFIGDVQLSEAICDDITIEFHYMVSSLQYHSITIPANETYASDRWGSCPPAYSSENVGVSSVSIASSCGGAKTIIY